MYLRKIMPQVVSCAEVSHKADAVFLFVEVCIESLNSITNESFDEM